MQLQINSKSQIDIKDIYALKLKSIWRGLRNEHLSFWFLCAYFLFEYVRPQVLYPALNVLPWAFLFLMLAVVAAFVDKNVRWVGGPLNKLFIAFCIILVVSGIFAYEPSASWSGRKTMLTWVIVYFLVICTVNSERRMLLFFMAYLLYSLKMSQHGVHSWVGRGFSFAKYGLIGSPGWFRNSGEYAIQMLIFGSLALAYVVSFRKYWGKVKKIIMYGAAATGYIAVIGASSRGSQLALAIIVAWAVLKIRGGFKFLIIAIVLGFLLFNLLPEKEIHRIQESGKDASSLQRLAYWRVGIGVIEDNPVLGVGYMNWTPYVSNLYPNGVGPANKIEVPHNIYILAAAELGYTGLICFILMVMTSFMINAQTRKMIKDSELMYIFYLSYGLEAGMLGFLVAGTFVTVLYYPFFWIQIAMIVMLNNVTRKMVAEKNEAT